MQLPEAAPGFDEPLMMLRACHTRILKQCDTLIRLAEHLRRTGPDDDAREAARQVRRYFSTAGKHHHEDEEQDLFPVLLNVAPELAPAVRGLRQEHREMEDLWGALESVLADIGSIADTAAFSRNVAHFQAVYRTHIERENNDILPAAQRVLSQDQLRTLGSHMAQRRGVTV